MGGERKNKSKNVSLYLFFFLKKRVYDRSWICSFLVVEITNGKIKTEWIKIRSVSFFTWYPFLCMSYLNLPLLSLIKIPIIGFRSHLPPGWFHPKILNWMYPVNILFINKVIFWDSRWTWIWGKCYPTCYNGLSTDKKTRNLCVYGI